MTQAEIVDYFTRLLDGMEARPRMYARAPAELEALYLQALAIGLDVCAPGDGRPDELMKAETEALKARGLLTTILFTDQVKGPVRPATPEGWEGYFEPVLSFLRDVRARTSFKRNP